MELDPDFELFKLGSATLLLKYRYLLVDTSNTANNNVVQLENFDSLLYNGLKNY